MLDLATLLRNMTQNFLVLCHTNITCCIPALVCCHAFMLSFCPSHVPFSLFGWVRYNFEIELKSCQHQIILNYFSPFFYSLYN
jgi:hypothetical protein